RSRAALVVFLCTSSVRSGGGYASKPAVHEDVKLLEVARLSQGVSRGPNPLPMQNVIALPCDSSSLDANLECFVPVRDNPAPWPSARATSSAARSRRSGVGR